MRIFEEEDEKEKEKEKEKEEDEEEEEEAGHAGCTPANRYYMHRWHTWVAHSLHAEGFLKQHFTGRSPARARWGAQRRCASA